MELLKIEVYLFFDLNKTIERQIRIIEERINLNFKINKKAFIDKLNRARLVR